MKAAHSRKIIIAASSADSNTKAGAYHICTGTNDAATIQSAINALGKGGIIEFTKGEFTIDTTMTIDATKACIT